MLPALSAQPCRTDSDPPRRRMPRRAPSRRRPRTPPASPSHRPLRPHLPQGHSRPEGPLGARLRARSIEGGRARILAPSKRFESAASSSPPAPAARPPWALRPPSRLGRSGLILPGSGRYPGPHPAGRGGHGRHVTAGSPSGRHAGRGRAGHGDGRWGPLIAPVTASRRRSRRRVEP